MPSTNMLRIYVLESVKDPLEISEVVHAGGRWTQVRHIHYVPGFLSHQLPILNDIVCLQSLSAITLNSII